MTIGLELESRWRRGIALDLLENVLGLTDAKAFADLEGTRRHGLAPDEGTLLASQIGQNRLALGPELQPSVLTRDVIVDDLDVDVCGSTEQDRLVEHEQRARVGSSYTSYRKAHPGPDTYPAVSIHPKRSRPEPLRRNARRPGRYSWDFRRSTALEYEVLRTISAASSVYWDTSSGRPLVR